MILAARLREALGLPGMTVERDGPLPRQGGDEAGARRAPASARRATPARRPPREVREAAERIGFPLIVKPIAGAGSADTYRVDDAAELERRARRASRHVAGGERRGVHRGRGVHLRHDLRRAARSCYDNIAWYRPAAARRAHRRVDQPADGRAARPRSRPTLAPGVAHGPGGARGARLRDRLHAHGVVPARPTARRSSARSAAARPARARPSIMNYALRHRPLPRLGRGGLPRRGSRSRSSAATTRAIIFKRAQGQGRIQRIEGLERLLGALGDAVVSRRPAAGRRAAPQLEADARSPTATSSCATRTCPRASRWRIRWPRNYSSMLLSAG